MHVLGGGERRKREERGREGGEREGEIIGREGEKEVHIHND